MRDIKFRAWDKQCRVMRCDSEVCAKVNPYNTISQFDILQRPGFELMQYTGLKDKNGKEIYEGDLMFTSKYSDKPRVVRWNEEEAHFELGLQGNNERDKSYLMIFAVNLEVIGNIYENGG